MSVEFWNSFFQWGSVALVAVTFVLGAGALWTGNRINERQTARLLVLEADLAKAKTQLSEQKSAPQRRNKRFCCSRQSQKRTVDTPGLRQRAISGSSQIFKGSI